MKIVKIISSLIIFIVLYLGGAYLSKQGFLYYYQNHDEQYDWLKEYKETKIKNKYKIVFIITEHGAIADREAGYRILAACKNLGWEVYTFENVDQHIEEINKINPDFVFTNKWKTDIGLKNASIQYKTYALVAHPTTTYFDDALSFYPKFKEHKFPELKMFDGFVISCPHLSLFKNYIEDQGKKFYGFRGFSSVQYQDYEEIDPKQLVYMGVNWDSKRKGSKFSTIFKTLAEKNEAVFYGSQESWENLVGPAYKGYFEGKDGLAVIDLIRKYGISLLLHSNQHIQTSTPSGRVFEAAAAGGIGISDLHPFIIENFGNNFLYIDTNKSAEDIIKQIEKHLKWIKENPDQVHQMTRNAYEIFINKYTLEELLENIAHMHEQILLDESRK